MLRQILVKHPDADDETKVSEGILLSNYIFTLISSLIFQC